MPVFLVTGREVLDRFGSPDFCRSLDGLYAGCPWSTPFQGRAFLDTWYSAYQSRYEPMLVVQAGDDGAIHGLLPLALDRSDGRLTLGGDQQAEYHGWLARPDDDGAFLRAALDLIRTKRLGRTLVFSYLPAGAPIGHLTDDADWRQRIHVRAARRPLLDWDSPDVQGSLSKKSNKSKLNRLKRLGEVRLEIVTDPTRFRAVLPAIIEQYDFRQGAVHDVCPFADDPAKEPFHHAMMGRPGLLHVSLLWAGEQLAAAHLGVVNGKEIHLAIFTYSPFLASHSPGKLLILMLAGELRGSGFTTLDLTPGDDWKDRFATRHDEVHSLRVFFRHRDAAAFRLKSRIRSVAKRALARLGISADKARGWMGRGEQKQQPAEPAHDWGRFLLPETSQPDRSLREWKPDTMERDSLADLLRFRARPGGPGRQSFLSTALSRFEAGDHCYTLTSRPSLITETTLQCSVWSAMDEHNRADGAALASVRLFDLIADAGVDGELLGHFLNGVLNDIRMTVDAAPDAGFVIRVQRREAVLVDALRYIGLREQDAGSRMSG